MSRPLALARLLGWSPLVLLLLLAHGATSLLLRVLPVGSLHALLFRGLRASYPRALSGLQVLRGERVPEGGLRLGDTALVVLDLARRHPGLRPLLRFLHARVSGAPQHVPMATSATPREPDETEPPRRSVAFFRHSYYNFFFLAEALRQRGWDAIVVNPEPEDGANERYFFGQDLRTHDPDPLRNRRNLGDFLERVAVDYSMLHLHGIGGVWVYPDHSMVESVPWEILELRERGVKIGFTISGCLDMVSQTSFRKWSGDMCRHCAWREREEICSDWRNLLLGQKVLELCDLVCNEAESLLDHRVSEKVHLDPLTGAMDPEFWRPDLEVPGDRLRERAEGELLIYHALGNAAERLEDGADVKGSRRILQAIESLKGRGHPVRLDFVTDLPSREVRFAQVQADIVVDQIRYGRWGATAREALMLGKPVVACINPDGGEGYASSPAITEAPVVHATPETIEQVLEDLVRDPERRAELGRQGRKHAVKWWSAAACAERYEKVYDRLMAGLPPMPEIPRAV